tara:strand:+ start:257 stop:760 length:504 start_codon:yes stop_codon:yes gene_type:complete
MGSLNKVMLIGNLGKDPEIRYTQAGSAVANFSLATTDRWTDKQGNRQEKTEWHDIVVFDRLADLAQNYLNKGKSIYVEGRLQTRSWEDQQGQKRYRTEVVANVIQFLDSKTSDGDSGGSRGGQAGSANQQNPGTQGAAGESGRDDQGGNSVQESRPDDDFIKDDIPF